MSSKITFLNEPGFWPIIIGAVILIGVFIWKELAIARRQRLILKLILSLLAISALILIALKPAKPSSETTGKIALLTPGHEKQQLDSLKKEYSAIKILEYTPKQSIPEDIHKAEVVYILGYGLKEYDLPQLANIPAVYLNGRTPEGIVKVRFPEKTSVGGILNINGLYRKPRTKNRIILEGPGGTGLDSIDLNTEEEQGFQLSSELKAPGNFVYFLVEKDSDGDILTRDPVPIQVEEKAGLKILILNNFPTFETKYLKNFLGEAGHELVVRSQITRGQYKYEYFNTGRKVIGNISRENLEPYDLLVVDAASLRNLGESEAREIEEAVREDGMGVFVQPDETFFHSPGSLVNLTFERQRNNSIKLEGWPEVDLHSYPFAIKHDPGQESIYTSGNSVIAGYKRKEQGRIGTATLSNTWQLILEGNSDTYRQIWSGIIGRLGKREELDVYFNPAYRFGFPHEPYNFKIRTDTSDPIISNIESGVIPLIQDVNFPELWKGTLWPKKEGWNRLRQNTSVVFNYYVAQEDSWSNLTAQNTLETNRRYFDRQLESGIGRLPLDPINPLWFYGLFLICMGGLWLIPKLS